ncbi:MAG: hypothetical protein Q8P50_13355 [Bacillota bacterium]|nr:hypothetical protein [Bacillota bacterium]
MLEKCNDLNGCEHVLSQAIKSVHLLADTHLDDSDVERLETMVRDYVAGDIGRALDLPRSFPCVVAYYLVHTGIRTYEDGRFWDVIADRLGLDEDIGWEQAWGRRFMHVLDTYSLPRTELGGSHKYVAAALLHGGIPDRYAREFMEKVVLELYESGTTDPESVLSEVRTIRQAEAHRNLQEHEKQELDSKLQSLKRLVRVSDRLRTVAETISGLPDIPEIPPGLEEEQRRLEAESTGIMAELAQLVSAGDSNHCDIAQCSQADRHIAGSADEINKACREIRELRSMLGSLRAKQGDPSGALGRPGDDLSQVNEDMAVSLRANLSLYKDGLDRGESKRSEIAPLEHQTRVASLAGVVGLASSAALFIAGLMVPGTIALVAALGAFAHRATQSRTLAGHKADLQGADRDVDRVLHEIAAGLGKIGARDPSTLREMGGPGLSDLAERLDRLARVNAESRALTARFDVAISRLRDLMSVDPTCTTADAPEEAAAKRLAEALIRADKARLAEDANTSQILPQIRNLELRISAIRARVAQIHALTERLPMSVERVHELREQRVALVTSRNRLNTLLDSLNEDLGAPASPVDEITMLEQRLREASRSVERPSLVTRLEQPIRRFIVLGGESADRTVVNCLSSLQRLASDLEASPSTDLHPVASRVLRAWRGARRHAPLLGARYSNPSIVLDWLNRRLAVQLPPQRFSETHATQELRVRVRDTSGTVLLDEPLSLVRTREGIESKYQEYPLDIQSQTYALSISSGNGTVLEWDLTVSEGGGLHFFDYASGRCLTGEVFPRQFWLLAPAGVTVVPTSVIIEHDEFWWQNISNRWVIYGIDLSNLRPGHAGLEIRVNGYVKRIRVKGGSSGITPEITGWTPSFTVNGSLTFTDHLPTVVLPIEEQDNLDSWTLLTWSSESLGTKTRRVYRLSEFTSATVPRSRQLLVALAGIDLPDVPVATMVMRLMAPDGMEYMYPVSIARDVRLEWERDIYGVSLGEPEALRASISVPEHLALSIEPPAHLVEQGTGVFTLVAAPGTQDIVLNIKVTGQGDLRVDIQVPQIRVGLTLDENALPVWGNSVVRSWIGGLESRQPQLRIRLPRGMSGQAVFAVEDTSRQLTSPVTNSTTIVNVASFMDSIRTVKPVSTVTFSVVDDHGRIALARAPVMIIATEWAISDVQAGYGADGRSTWFTWKEPAFHTERWVRILHASSPWHWRREARIPPDDRMIKIPEVLESGAYIVEVQPVDAWDQLTWEKPWPRTDAPGAKHVFLTPPAPWPQSIDLRHEGRKVVGTAITSKVADDISGALPDLFYLGIWLGDEGNLHTLARRTTINPMGQPEAVFQRTEMQSFDWLALSSLEQQGFGMVCQVDRGRKHQIPITPDTVRNIGLLTVASQVAVKPRRQEYLEHIHLTSVTMGDVLDLVTGKRSTCRIDMVLKSGSGRGELVARREAIELQSAQAVRCVVCGEVFASQRAWDDHWYERCSRGKERPDGFLRLRRVPVDLYLVLDRSVAVKRCQERFFGWDVCSSEATTLARWVGPSQWHDWLNALARGDHAAGEALVEALLQREMKMLEALAQEDTEYAH